MKCQKGLENCKICNKKESLFEYITGVSFKKWREEYLQWREVIIVFTLPLILLLIFGWWGIPIAFVIWHFMKMSLGDWGTWIWESEEEAYPPNTCSAGFEDCEICPKTFIHDHEFNIRYYSDKPHFLW